MRCFPFLSLALSLGICPLLAACPGEEPAPDSGSPAPDPAPEDAGESTTDGGDHDAGADVEDAGAPNADAGASAEDGGGTPADAGQDAGGAAEDAGTPADGGATADSGTPADGGPPDDAGEDKPRFPFGQILAYVSVPQAEDLIVQGDAAYVCAKGNGVKVFDISFPQGPLLTTTLLSQGESWDVTIQGELLLLADRTGGGLRIFDIGANPTNPNELGSYVPGWNVEQVATGAGVAYISGGDGQNGKFEVVDISDPQLPNRLGEFSGITGNNSAGNSLAAQGTTVYYGRADGRVVTLNASDPTAIQQTNLQAAHQSSSSWALGLFVDNDRLYHSDWGEGVHIYDISTPTLPVELGTHVNNNYQHYDTWARDDRAYVAFTGGLDVVDVSDSASPSLVQNINTTPVGELDDGLHGVWVQDEIAYLADNRGGRFTIVSVYEGPIP